jgi:hypothetical protein
MNTEEAVSLPAGASDIGWVDLYWLPLGAGDRFPIVRWNGRLFEGLVAHHQHRAATDLYHSALVVQLRSDRFAIEMAPVWGNKEADRGAVSEGPVGFRWLVHSRFFRYEVRRWRNGVIPDIAAAVASPQRLSANAAQAQELLELVPAFPNLAWGRDELRTGEMWNSNSLTSWLLARSGHPTDLIELPARGRAPGWSAGLVAAGKQGTAKAAAERR